MTPSNGRDGERPSQARTQRSRLGGVAHLAAVDGRLQAPRVAVAADRQRGVAELHQRSSAGTRPAWERLARWSDPQNRKYRWASGSSFAGSQASSSPSAQTRYVSGSTSISGVRR